MGVISGIGTGLAGLFNALSTPLFTRKTKYYNRRKGVLQSTYEDTWSISLAHVLFVWLVIVAIKVLREHKNDTPEAQAAILAALMLAGPFAGLAVAFGLGNPPIPGLAPDDPAQKPKYDTGKSKAFFEKILDIARNLVDILPGGF